MGHTGRRGDVRPCKGCHQNCREDKPFPTLASFDEFVLTVNLQFGCRMWNLIGFLNVREGLGCAAWTFRQGWVRVNFLTLILNTDENFVPYPKPTSNDA